MHRISALLSVVVIVLLGGFAVGRLAVVTDAQEASPRAEAGSLPAELSFQVKYWHLFRSTACRRHRPILCSFA